MTRNIAWGLVATVWLFGGSLVEGLASASEPAEDEPGWSCVDNGNHICGPGNAEGVPAGHYDEGGVLDIPWFKLAH